MKRLSPTARRKAENAPRADDRAPSQHGAPAAELTRLGDSALCAFVYPNLMINRYGPWMDVNVVLPTGPNECMVLFDYFIRADATGATDAFVSGLAPASDGGAIGEFIFFTSSQWQLDWRGFLFLQEDK